MEKIEQTISFDLQVALEQNSIKTALAEFALCSEDFSIIQKTLMREETLEEFPEFTGFTKIYQDEDCGFASKTGEDRLNIEVIMLVPSEKVKIEHGDNCIQGYRIWLDYQYNVVVLPDNENLKINFNCLGVDLEEDFISEIDTLNPSFDDGSEKDDDDDNDLENLEGDDDDD